MAILPLFKFAGLQLTDNELSSIPDGSCVRAENVVSTGHGVIEPRPGQGIFTPGYLFNGMPLEIFYPTNLTPEPGPQTFTRILSVTGDRLVRIKDDGTPEIFLSEDGLDDVFTPPSEITHRMKGAEAGRNFYITTTQGVRRIESSDVSVPVRLAGVPRNPGVVQGFFNTNVDGVFPKRSKVTYSVVICYIDDNGVLHQGPPSPRFDLYELGVSSAGPNYQADLKVRLPPGVDEQYFVQLYRTATKTTTLPTDDPFPLVTDDEMALVVERYITTSEVAAGFMLFTDNTPDGFLTTPLYTNQNTGDTIVAASNPPPLCQDITQWEDRLWYANTSQTQSATISLMGVMDADVAAVGGAANTALRTGDILDISGVKFVAANSTDPTGYGSLNRYEMRDAATLSATQQVSETAKRLVDSINATGLYLAALTGSGLNPGEITITSLTPDSGPFELRVDRFKYTPSTVSRSGTTVTAVVPGGLPPWRVGDSVTLSYPGSVDANFPAGTYVVTSINGSGVGSFTYTDSGSGSTAGSPSLFRYQRAIPNGSNAWSPPIPQLGAAASNSDVISDNDDVPNRLFYSKAQEPEAVPALNYLDIGQPGKPILRILPLRNRLVVFKTDGIFLVYGVEPFSVESLDSTVILTAPDSAISVANQVIALTNQGVVTVTEGGINIISRAIESELNAYQKQGIYSKTGTFSTSHEVAHLYGLWLGRTATSAGTGTKYSDFGYILNTLTGAWTKWRMHQRTCGRVNPFNAKLGMGSLGSSLDPVLDSYWEDNDDGWDESEVIDEVDSWDPVERVLVLTSAIGGDVSDVAIGDRMTQGTGDPDDFEGIVSAVDIPTRTITFSSTNGVVPISGDPVDVHKAIDCIVEYATITCGDPTSLKQFRDINTHFRTQLELQKYELLFDTDLTTSESSITATHDDFTIPPDPANFENRRPTHDRAQFPQDVQRGSYLHLTFHTHEAGSHWELNGFSLVFENGSERNKVR